ncbi:hypothetical protein L7F22_011801 [Adiantum nelumboides]|nr:hypothetical protein [Adiantum nelumboides]
MSVEVEEVKSLQHFIIKDFDVVRLRFANTLQYLVIWNAPIRRLEAKNVSLLTDVTLFKESNTSMWPLYQKIKQEASTNMRKLRLLGGFPAFSVEDVEAIAFKFPKLRWLSLYHQDTLFGHYPRKLPVFEWLTDLELYVDNRVTDAEFCAGWILKLLQCCPNLTCVAIKLEHRPRGPSDAEIEFPLKLVSFEHGRSYSQPETAPYAQPIAISAFFGESVVQQHFVISGGNLMVMYARSGAFGQFMDLWDKWIATLALGEKPPNFLKRDRFVACLCPPLKDKVKARLPVTFEEAREVARVKERKLSQLEDFFVHLIKAPAPPEHGRGKKRPPQDYHCYNCDEEGHQMYFCPHSRRNANYRGPKQQVSPPRGRQEQLYQPPIPMQQAPPMQILRPPPPPPQQHQPPPPPAPITPLPPVPENRTVSIINLDAKEKAKVKEQEVSLPKGKGKSKEKKQEEVDAMPIKRSRQEEIVDSEADTRRKTKESAESSKKKTKPQQKLTIKDFSLGESSQPYGLVDDVSMQGPKISWSQLLYLPPKVCRRWSKMVSTRRVKTKAMGLVSGRRLKDIVPVMNDYVKGQRISNVYVDGGAQICVMSEHVFHHLGLKISAPAPYKAKMANNVKVKCLGIVNGVKVKVCEVEVEVDGYVMLTKGEGYPIVLGRPWLMAM